MKKYNNNNYWDDLIEGYKREKKVGVLEIISVWCLYVLVVGLIASLIIK
jgi:hypothetical protein